MKTLREQMLQYMQLKGYSPRTIDTYLESVAAISKHFNLSPDLLTSEQLREFFLARIQVDKRSKSYLNQHISALKLLFVCILKREWDPLLIPRPRREKKLPVVFSREEVERILNAPRNIKHRAMLLLIYSAGLRRSELLNLRVSDIDSARMMVRVVQAKGFKDRYSILSPVALDALRLYWKFYKPTHWLFEGQGNAQYSAESAQKVLKAALVKAGVNKKCGLHTLRHSFATHLLEQGVSLPIIQQLLGHKSLRTTSGYLHVQQYALDKVRSPLDTLSL